MNPADPAASGLPDSQPSEPANDARVENDPRVGIDETVAALDVLAELPLSAHVERFEAVHTELTAALSSIDRV